MAQPITEQNLRHIIGQGLLSLRDGGRVSAKGAGKIEDAATHPDLKAALKDGSALSKEWMTRIDAAIREVGAEGDRTNEVLPAILKTAEKARDEAPDAASRDLGIVAASRMAIHYWTAAFGTSGMYLGELGLSDSAQAMTRCHEEAQQQDERLAKLAKQLVSVSA